MTERVVTALDTSVAIPLLMASHRAHPAVAAWASGRTLSLCGHALVETYSVLTRLPGDARVRPSDAVRLLDADFAPPTLLDADGMRGAVAELARTGVAGGATYDGLVALAARAHAVALATRDARARSTYEVLGVTVELLADYHPA